mmetsp:Transcript_101960/g.297361  ORF Transcript_101960/g.297361 Transcript_101960/m.297361 type:complete len:280 (-) Transcript_101960:221-1060(-)
MVDLSLEAVNVDAIPPDLYLSLRVGESQKFTKASSSRDYKFAKAAVGDRRYAKMEIYKRVGVCSMCIDKEKVEGTHEIAVPVDDSRLDDGQVRYRVTLDSVPGEHTVESRPPTRDLSSKAAAAREYLDKHQLEQRLSQAMQAVLRERPEDPAAFVAQKLLSGVGVMTKVDPEVQSSAPPKTPPAGDAAPGAGAKESQTKAAAPESQTKAAAPAAPTAEAAAASATEAAAAPAVREEAKAGAFEPAVPYPLADPITPMSLVVMPGFVGFSTMMGPGMMVI